jgi:hypothetical protein
VHAEAALAEQLVERDTVRAVRLPREEVTLHRRGEPARVLAVLGRHDVVRDERAVEGDDRVAAASEPPRVEAEAVVHRPGHEWQRGGEHEGGGSLDSHTPCTRDEEGHDPECE